MIRKSLLFLFGFLPSLIFAQTLSNTTNINITKTWSQEPSGWTYPIMIHLPTESMPADGYPVAIVLHGNGGNGNGSIAQWRNTLTNHIIVGPSGYNTSWNIADEASDAPDVEMIGDLVDQLQTYSNVNPNKIRLIGSSNGSGLCNRVFIENDDPGIDIICGIVSQLNVPQYHDNNFHFPSGATGDPAPFDGYDTPKTPITGRRFLSICNDNDPIIPYLGGSSPVGVDFLDAQEAIFLIAQSQGYTGEKLPTAGTQLGTSSVYEYAYLSNQVVHLRGDARHSASEEQREYVNTYFNTVLEDNDSDNDGIITDLDCNDNDPNIGAKQTEGTTCDDGDDTTENDQIQADGCSCVGTTINTSGCLAPTNPTVNGARGRRININWTAVDGARHYIIQIRFKGTNRWLVTTRVKGNRVHLYGAFRSYEYRIKSICEDGESPFSPIYEFSIPTVGGLTSATSRNKEVEATEIFLEETATLYPNPVATQLNLFYQTKTEKATFLIYDGRGRMVYEQNLSEATTSYAINLSDLETGFYLGVVKETGKVHFFEKFIKQ